MKDLLSKIKTLDYKQFALNHGEKIGIGLVGLTVGIICLVLTSWGSEYTGDPQKMEAAAENVVEKLRQNVFTEDRQKEFPYRLAVNELPKVVNGIDPAQFEWLRDISPKLHQKQQPAEEAKWYPPVDLLAFWTTLPMGVNVPPPAEAEDDAKGPKPAGTKKRDREKKGDELLGMPAAGMDAFSAAGGEKASGRRVVSVLGVVEIRRQEEALKRALNVNSLSEVKDRLVYKAFKVQRQRAVPGPDPWPNDEKSWKDVNIGESIAVLGEASDFDAEVVPARYTNVEFTSPLPRRVDGDWEYNLVVHPRIPILEEEARNMELEINRKALEAQKEAGEAEQNESGGSGFSLVQKDVNKLRRNAQGNSAFNESMSKYSDMAKRMMPPGTTGGPRGGSSVPGRGPAGGYGGGMGPPPGLGSGMMPGMAMGSGSRGVRPPSSGPSGMGTGSMMDAGRMMPMGMNPGMYPGMNMGSAMGGVMAGTVDMGADIQLFRFFDFDVEPGECYRYRVKLIVENPTLDDPFVAQPTVAQGKTRESPWSGPSTPAVVKKDVEFGLASLHQKKGEKGKNDGAELSVVQFDPNFGSYLMDTIRVYFGSYIGGSKDTLHLDFVAPTFKEEPVTFSSKDVLLDGAGSELAKSAATDLGLDPRKSKRLLEMAVTLNRFGEIEDLDADSIDALGAAKKRVAEEREPYKEIKETKADKKKKEADDALDEAVGKKGKKGKKGAREKAGNPLKGGYPGAGAMMPGMPGVGLPPPGVGGVSPPPRGRSR